MSDDEEMVPNPTYTALQQFRTKVSTAQPDIEEALDGAATRLENGAWRGSTTAATFAEELDGRRRRLGTVVDDILDEIDTKLATTESEVRESRANAIRMVMESEGLYL